MGWATAHSQSFVTTLQCYHDRRGAVCTTGAPTSTTKDLRSRERARACQGRLVATVLLEFSIATESSMSRQS